MLQTDLAANAIEILESVVVRGAEVLFHRRSHFIISLNSF